jgi:hypothetical protein
LNSIKNPMGSCKVGWFTFCVAIQIFVK